MAKLDEIRKARIKKEAEVFSGSFRAFVEAAWSIVEPGVTFLPGMHIDAICEHLQACAEGKIRKLLINIQPRASKTTLVSIMYPAWMWTFRPTERMLFGSYALDLAREASTKTRRLIKSDWYHEHWPHVEITEDQDTKGYFANTLTGHRQITSVNGPTTGLGGSQLILDDPLSARDADSSVIRETTLQWIKEAWSTRQNPSEMPAQICVMQRLHQQDPAGYFLSEGGWEHLCLPTEYEGEKHQTTIGWDDPRTEPGEVLWPARYGTPSGKKDLVDLKRTLGAVGVAGQLQQRPVPRGGGTFKKEWLYFWYDDNIAPPEPILFPKPDGTMHECPQHALDRGSDGRGLDYGSVINSWDLAFKGGEKNDFVVGQTWVRGTKMNRTNHYLLDQIRGNFDFVQTIAKIRELNRRNPPACTLVEEKANGSAVIASLKSEIPAIIAVNPLGGKESRASGIAPMFEAGNIWLPHPKMLGFEWVQGYIDELTMFPRGTNDDQVDATTQALIRLKERVVEDIDMAPSFTANSSPSPWRI